MPHWPIPPWQKITKYDLSRVTAILKVLDDPHLKLPPVIHIAGTNGKGSSAAMLKSIFEQAGYKAHVYTSPHLIEFNERIVLQGEKISDEYLYEICERTRMACDKIGLDPSFFEGTTAAAFLAFAETPADIVILETGLGGRLDATNVVPSPIATLIAPISFDHMEYLGSDLKTIAGEKAGIIKRGVPCVISAQVEEVYQVFFVICNKIEAPAFCYEYDFGVKKTEQGFLYLSQNLSAEFSNPSLKGDHQIINAASVIALISLINDRFKINNEAINRGLQKASWPGRIELVVSSKAKDSVSDNIRIWLDGAHNSGGAQVLSDWIREELVDEDVYLILGMTKNRNVEQFSSYFQKLIKKGFGVRVLSEPSSYSAEEVASRAGQLFEPADSMEDAIREISKIVDPSKRSNIIICGSLFLIADFKSRP
jgi:dihydrofolate synthase/folylpolyglutamate synthase